MTKPKAPLVDVRSDRTGLSWIFDLYRMTPAISKASPQEVSQRLLEHIVTGFAAGSGCLAVSDVETPDRLAIVAGIGLPQGVIGSHVTRGDGVLGWVAQHAEPLLLQNDVQNDPRFKFTVARTETKVPGSAMCWPLQSGDRVLGVVSVNRPFDQPPFSADDLEHGSLVMGLVTVMMENTRLQIEQAQRIEVLSTLNDVMNKINLQLEETQGQLLQSEKMASIGQLAAGVAHEINNPIGYVNSNLGSLEQFLQELFAVLAAYERLDSVLPEAALRDIQAVKTRADLDYLRQDSFALLGECR
ncbi:MAG: GAF domain-containing protein [Casimicrobiaceae bacterium]